MWYIYKVKYSALKKLKFLGKWMELETIMLGDVIQIQRRANKTTTKNIVWCLSSVDGTTAPTGLLCILVVDKLPSWVAFLLWKPPLHLLLPRKLVHRAAEFTSVPVKEHTNLLFGAKESGLKIYIHVTWTQKLILRNIIYMYTNTCVCMHMNE